MRFLVILLVIGSLGYLGYRYYQKYQDQAEKIEQLKLENQELRDRLQGKPTSGTTRKITCPVCRGEGRLMVRRANKRDVSYACPVCHGTGSRQITIPPGSRICPDCSGMGFCPVPDTQGGEGRRTATRCMRCHCTGHVKGE